jgi:LCP family protein required for cell wall assembly
MQGPVRDNPYRAGGPPAGARPPGPPGPPGGASPPRFPSRPPRRSWVQRTLLTVGIVTTVACLTASAYSGYQLAQVGGLGRVEGADNLVEAKAGDPANWLLVGSDTRDGLAGNRTDTIMIVRIDPAAGRVNVLSLQRDLWLPIAGTKGVDRINAAYGVSDTPDRLIDTIKLNFDLDINHYVEVGFDSFKGIVDAVGGVPMYFDRPLRDTHSGLAVLDRGCVTLSGDQALAFARSRYLEFQDEKGRWQPDLSIPDYARISRQQYFIRRMFDRAAGRAKNPRTLNDLVGVAKANVKLDKRVDVNEVLDMVKKFGDVHSDAIKSWTLPTKPFTTAGGAEVLALVRNDDTASVLNIFKGFDPHDTDPHKISFTIQNGNGVNGQAAQVQEAFGALGYRAEVSGDAPGREARTTIRFGWGGGDAAAQIERHVTSGATVSPDGALGAGEVVLTTGADFTTVLRRPRPYVPPPLPPAPVGEGAETTTTAKTSPGAKTTKPSTTTTTAPTHNNGDTAIGVVPGQPPEGVTCD